MLKVQTYSFMIHVWYLLPKYKFFFLDYENCRNYFDEGNTKTGHYYIQRNGTIQQVYCDMLAINKTNCADYFESGFRASDIYNVYTNGNTIQVNCIFENGKYCFSS